ncbi:hypothetical protein BN1263140074 [Stenotrophomonas thermophila]|nr:hypothetical protein BN1263140074 [Stenotrophomonas maltophilia]
MRANAKRLKLSAPDETTHCAQGDF